ncbi:hypothetical protein ACLB2K_050454 [Fragaria x ananassa]
MCGTLDYLPPEMGGNSAKKDIIIAGFLIYFNKEDDLQRFYTLVVLYLSFRISFAMDLYLLRMDSIRLYLINSPAVREEPLRVKKEGVYCVVSQACISTMPIGSLSRMQRDLRLKGLPLLSLLIKPTLQKSSDVLDQWMNSATQSLVYFVRQEMNGYRLYTVDIIFSDGYLARAAVPRCLYGEECSSKKLANLRLGSGNDDTLNTKVFLMVDILCNEFDFRLR